MKIPVIMRGYVKSDLPHLVEMEDQVRDSLLGDEISDLTKNKNSLIAEVEADESKSSQMAQRAGYLIYDVRGTTIEIIRLVVGRHFRRSDVGRQMIDKLKTKLTGTPGTAKRLRLKAMVNERDTALLMFFRKLGFKGTLAKRWFKPDDGIMMVFGVPEPREKKESDS